MVRHRQPPTLYALTHAWVCTFIGDRVVNTGYDSPAQQTLTTVRSKLRPFFSALPGDTLYIHEYRWCIEPWVSERSALEAWPSAALRFGHSNLEPARHLWLEASAIQTLRATYREP